MSLAPKVVITDDEVRMTDSLKILLGDKGYNITTFHNGEDTLNYIRPNNCDLLLLDIMMPGMDGYEVIKRLKDLHPELAIITMTGQSSIDSAIRALRGGAYDYLCKPFEYDELIKKIDNALSHRRLSKVNTLISHQLKSTDARYQYLVHNSPDIIFALGSEDKFVFITDKISNCTDLSSQDLLGRDFSTIVHPQDVKRVQDYFKGIRSGDTAKDLLELSLKCAACGDNGTPCTGSHKLMEMKAVSLSHGEPEGESSKTTEIYGIMRDITKRRRDEEEKTVLENQLQRAQKMEAIGTLAGGIAHDFNNLLVVIQGYASLSLMNLEPSHPNYERLKRIEDQVQSGADLTRRLLGFARGGRYEVKPTDINETLDKTSSMFGRTRKEISIYHQYGKDLWSVIVDRGQMAQVFMNLYVNAWQAMPGGGEIYLQTENVIINETQAILYAMEPRKYVKITVADTGTGMDENTRTQIFDPFFTTKEMGRGTGLGLATVYGIIKGHKGWIQVDSEPSHGATFSIYLPASAQEVVKEKTVIETIERGTETILLVDDEKTVLEVSKEVLESMGYRVYTAGSGQEALTIYMERKDDIDLVILDMIMPGMSGRETFDRLREINSRVKVLLSSGYSIAGEAKTIMDHGCNGFLQKPYHPERLSSRVREMLDGNRSFEQQSSP